MIDNLEPTDQEVLPVDEGDAGLELGQGDGGQLAICVVGAVWGELAQPLLPGQALPHQQLQVQPLAHQAGQAVRLNGWG